MQSTSNGLAAMVHFGIHAYAFRLRITLILQLYISEPFSIHKNVCLRLPGHYCLACLV